MFTVDCTIGQVISKYRCFTRTDFFVAVIVYLGLSFTS